MGLVTADKPESQEICFVPTGDYRDLLKKRLEPTHPAFLPGKIVTRNGEILGEHHGYANFTVGQRRGLPGGFPEAIFVLEIRPDTREVVVGTRDALLARRVEVGSLNWLVDPQEIQGPVEVQLRHRARPAPARLSMGEGSVVLVLDTPQPAVTPGQSAVIFQGDLVLGGGRIEG
jgi:tRNA-specific 2-thiouridylase